MSQIIHLYILRTKNSQKVFKKRYYIFWKYVNKVILKVILTALSFSCDFK